MSSFIILFYFFCYKELYKLETLWLHGNKLKSIHSGTLQGKRLFYKSSIQNSSIILFFLLYVYTGLGNLKYLDLSKNLIEFINQMAFKGLTNLKQLGLEDNEILIINKDTFSHLTS